MVLRSMTAFGRGEGEVGDTGITVEIRCVNHRFRDVVMRLPKALQPLEEGLRSQVGSRVARGRIEVSVQVEARGEQPDVNVELNIPLAEAYFRVYRELQERFGADSSVSAETFCQNRDVVVIRPVEKDLDVLEPVIGEVLEKALEAVDQMRLEEGKALERDFRKRIDLVGGYLSRVEERSPQVVEDVRTRLQERVAVLTDGLELDEGRLAQEVALFAGRSDITEEIVRSRSHLGQFGTYLESEEPVGRRLDFLIQELNREVNTIASKASDATISSLAVEIKAEIEKLREQVQNVE
jgi:uncharacterized protein (TIGR00255 family)